LFDIVIGPEKFQALVNELKRLSEKSKDHLAREALWCKAKGNTPEASS
jgi:CRISPR/Cas system-associated protein Csm6